MGPRWIHRGYVMCEKLSNAETIGFNGAAVDSPRIRVDTLGTTSGTNQCFNGAAVDSPRIRRYDVVLSLVAPGFNGAAVDSPRIQLARNSRIVNDIARSLRAPLPWESTKSITQLGYNSKFLRFFRVQTSSGRRHFLITAPLAYSFALSA